MEHKSVIFDGLPESFRMRFLGGFERQSILFPLYRKSLEHGVIFDNILALGSYLRLSIEWILFYSIAFYIPVTESEFSYSDSG